MDGTPWYLNPIKKYRNFVHTIFLGNWVWTEEVPAIIYSRIFFRASVKTFSDGSPITNLGNTEGRVISTRGGRNERNKDVRILKIVPGPFFQSGKSCAGDRIEMDAR